MLDRLSRHFVRTMKDRLGKRPEERRVDPDAAWTGASEIADDDLTVFSGRDGMARTDADVRESQAAVARAVGPVGDAHVRERLHLFHVPVNHLANRAYALETTVLQIQRALADG